MVKHRLTIQKPATAAYQNFQLFRINFSSKNFKKFQHLLLFFSFYTAFPLLMNILLRFSENTSFSFRKKAGLAGSGIKQSGFLYAFIMKMRFFR